MAEKDPRQYWQEVRRIINKHTVDPPFLGHLLIRPCHLLWFEGNMSAAVVLAFILNQFRVFDSIPEDREKLIENMCRFCCPLTTIQRYTFMKKDKVTSAIKYMVDQGLIATRNGQGNLLWVSVNHPELEGMEWYEEDLDMVKELEKRRYRRSF